VESSTNYLGGNNLVQAICGVQAKGRVRLGKNPDVPHIFVTCAIPKYVKWLLP